MSASSHEPRNDIANLGGPAMTDGFRVFRDPLEPVHRCRPNLANFPDPRWDGEAILVWILEQHRGTLCRHHAVSAHVVQEPDRHVACVGSVADIDGVYQHY